MANVPDTKKVADLVNRVAMSMTIIREQVQLIKDVRTLFQATNPSLAGTPFAGGLSGINTAINTLDTAAAAAAFDPIIAAYEPTHQGNSL